MMDCVLSGSLLVVFSLFCYAVCFLEQINSLSLYDIPKRNISASQVATVRRPHDRLRII